MNDTQVNDPRPNDTRLNHTNHTENKLIGTWKLVSASSTTRDGERNDIPYGPNPVGFLTYGRDGRMTALISYGGRKLLTVGGASQEEQAAAFTSFLAYAGRYKLKGDQVVHSVEIASIQNYVNTELVRNITFEENRIILTTPPTRMNGKIQIIELIWQRVAAASGLPYQD